jgi:molybdate transport system ATP-binding protein
MNLEVDITLRQGRFVLSSAFAFHGSALGLFGPSGSGKSTLMRIVSGLTRPDCGQIRLNGEILFDSLSKVWVPAHERRIGVVFQDARLFPHRTTAQNLRAGMMEEQTGLFSFAHIVDLLEIEPLLGRPVNNLSGGEKQRIALGRALLAHPRLLLLDEPLSGLDAGLKDQILPFLKRINTDLHLPCIMVSHSLPEIAQITDQILMVNNGCISGPAPVAELVLDKQHFDSLRSSGLMSMLTFPEGSVGVRPDEVLLADRPVEGLSAQHRIEGVVEKLIDHGEIVLCLVKTHAGEVMADVTPQAVQQLNLIEGGSVWCIFKSCAVRSVRA